MQADQPASKQASKQITNKPETSKQAASKQASQQASMHAANSKQTSDQQLTSSQQPVACGFYPREGRYAVVVVVVETTVPASHTHTRHSLPASAYA